jgi:hypothetical protein
MAAAWAATEQCHTFGAACRIKENDMVAYVKKVDMHSVAKEAEDNRFEQIRKAAAEKRRKSDSDGTQRRARQNAANNRLL